MWKFFDRLFAKAPARRPAPPRQARLRLEAFEPRDMPSGLPALPSLPSLPSPPSVSHPSLPPLPSAPALPLFALLHSGRANAIVSFQPAFGSHSSRFDVLALGLSANTTYTVRVGTAVAGTFTTNSRGAGQLHVNNLTPAPAGGASVQILAGTTVALSGAFNTPPKPPHA